MRQTFLKLLWSSLTALGPRRCARCVRCLRPYGDTLFFVDRGATTQKRVALTIDDGLSRGGAATSLTSEVLALLKSHGAHATFFVCSDYLSGVEAEADALVAAGHELGNHLREDRPGYYWAGDAIAGDIAAATAKIAKHGSVRWFRAPQGLLSPAMSRACREQGLRHALGDAYCDDWAVPDPEWIASTMLSQVSDGSVIIVHMPEKGFRPHLLRSLALLLDGLSARGYECATLSELSAAG